MDKMNCFGNNKKNKRLTTDYEKLVKMYYKEPLLYYGNLLTDKINLLKAKLLMKSIESVFPVICLDYGKPINIIISDNKNDKYMLTHYSEEYYQKLMDSYHGATIYDSEMIRVNGWSLKRRGLELHTGRTSYFNSLVTNRAIDLELLDGVSLRDLCEPGPYVSALENSELSNHLGFTGFIETSDGYIPFIKRSQNVSIGQKTLGCSVSASLKIKYCLNYDKNFTIDGLYNGILNEINDELKISEEYLDKNSCAIIGIYRDLIEGGKPQLLFYCKTVLDKFEVEYNFKREMETAFYNSFLDDGNELLWVHKNEHNFKQKKENTSFNSVLEDGNEILWVHKSELTKMCILPGYIIIDGKEYKTMPSHSASIVMLLRYFDRCR